MDERQRLYASFQAEAWESLAAIEQLAIGLAGPRSDSVAHTLKVFCHRLKGSASILRFTQIAVLSSRMEALVAAATTSADHGTDRRTGELLAACVAALATALQKISITSPTPDQPEIEALLPQLDQQITTLKTQQGSALEQAIANLGNTDAVLSDHGSRELLAFRRAHPDVLSYFAPEATEHIEGMVESLTEIEENGPSKDVGQRLFRQVHTLKGSAFTVGCQPMGELAHRMEDLLVLVRKGTTALTPPMARRLGYGVDGLRAMLEVLDGRSVGLGAQEATSPETTVSKQAASQQTVNDSPPSTGILTATQRSTIRVPLSRIDGLLAVGGELVLARGRMEGLVERLGAVGEQLGDSRKRMLRTVREFEAKHLNPSLLEPHDSFSASAVPASTVPAARDESEAASMPGSLLDGFSDLDFDRYDDFNILARRVGEIASDLTEIHQHFDEGLRNVRSELAKVRNLTQELRSRAYKVRMIQIGGLFKRLTRLANNLAEETGKSVHVETLGSTVEIDGELVEHIIDPLLHLVRNAVVHGIENVQDRQSAGKPASGTISLKAHSDGQLIHIEVEDDGGGIDNETLRDRAIAQQLVAASDVAGWPDEKLMDLVYLPGLSILDAATTSAGRGIGMDVVRRNIEQIGGRIQIESSRGTGTRFLLRLPLTLVTSEALIVRVGDEWFGIPVRDITHIAAISEEQLERHDGAVRLDLEDTWVDAVDLADAFGMAVRQNGSSGSAISIDLGDRVFALIVDNVVGIEEVVFHPLGSFLDGLPGFSSFAMSAATGLVLVLNPAALEAGAGSISFGSSAADSAPPTSDLATVGAHARRTILLADDSISVRKIVGGMLERAGFDVVPVRDGQEALDAIHQQRFDALLTDLEMPRLNGYELIDAVRSRPASRDLPIVVLTTRVGERHAELARQLGVDGYCAKPIDKETLLSLIENVTVQLSNSSRSTSDDVSHG